MYILVTILHFSVTKIYLYTIIRICFWHPRRRSRFFFFVLMCRGKKACVSLQHNGSDNAVVVFVAASRNDRAQHGVPHSAVGHLSPKNRSLKNTVSLLPLPHDAYMLTSTYVYICVFVNIHIFRNMCMGANVYNTT